MPLNLLKKYPELLDFLSLTTQNRTISLRNILVYRSFFRLFLGMYSSIGQKLG